MAAKLREQRTQFAPRPFTKAILVPKDGPRRIKSDEMQFGEAWSEKLPSMFFCHQCDLVPFTRGAKQGGGESEIAEAPEFEHEELWPAGEA